MSGKEVEFVPLLVSALKQEGIAGRGNRKSSASFDWQFKYKVLFEVRPHQPEFIVIIKPQVFFFVQADGVAVIDGIVLILPERSSLRCPCNQAASTQRFIPTVITKYTFVKVAGNDGAIFFYHTVLNAIPQAETGQHSSVPADDPGVLVGAVFPIGASCPQQEEVITCGPQIMKLELQEAKRKQRRFQHPLFRPIQLDFHCGIGGRSAEPVLTLCFGRPFHEKIDFSIPCREKVCHFCALQMFFPAQLVQVNDGEQRQIFGFYRFVHSVSSWLL